MKTQSKGTAVKNPVARLGYPRFKTCSGCGAKFTALGLSRHWDHCAYVIPAIQRWKQLGEEKENNK